MSIVAALVVLTPAETDKEKAVARDREKLQGAWVAVSYEFRGQKLAEDELKELTVTIDGDNWTMHLGTEVMKGTHSLDPSKKPKQFDGVVTEGTMNGDKVQGIYEIDGDTWKECWADPDKARPTEFKADSTAGHNMIVWKRKKK